MATPNRSVSDNLINTVSVKRTNKPHSIPLSSIALFGLFYIALTLRWLLNNKMVTIRKKAVVAYPKHYFTTCVDRLKTANIDLKHYSRICVRLLKQARPKHKFSALPLHQYNLSLCAIITRFSSRSHMCILSLSIVFPIIWWLVLLPVSFHF